jgi:hypothetical protein
VCRKDVINHFNNQESEDMDAQIDHAAGMPIGLLDELPPPVDATESFFSALQAPLAQGHLARSLTDIPFRGFSTERLT